MKQFNLDVQNYDGLGWLTVDCVATTNIATTVGQTIDGVLVSATTRVLKVGQTAPAENGIYVNDVRAPDMEEGTNTKNTFVNGPNKLYFCQSGIIGNNLNWSSFNINNLGDALITAPSTNQILQYNGTKWANTTFGSGVASFNSRTGAVTSAEGDYTLTQLGDVTITTPATNQILQYNGSGWVNSTFGSGVASFNSRTGAVTSAEGDYTLTQLSDVTITTPATNNLVYYNGTTWVNGTVQTVMGTSWCAPTAELFFQGSYALTLTNINTWYKIAPSATFLTNNTSYTSTAWSNPSNGTLRWVFPFNSRLFHVAVSLSQTNSGHNQTQEMAIYVNGVIVTASTVVQRLQSSTDRQIFSFHKALVLNQKDTVEIYTRNIISSGTTAIFNNFNLILMSCCSYPTST